MPIEKFLPGRFSISLRSGFDAMAFQNILDGRVRENMAEVCYCALNGPQVRFSSAIRPTRSTISVGVLGRPEVRYVLPSYFLAINFRCQANSVWGVTMVATCVKIFRLSFFALAANRQRWLSVNRIRRLPICSRRTRFSSIRYSITCCWR